MRLSRRLKRASFWLVYLLFLFLLVETGSRAFWKARGVPFFTAQKRIYRSFYPEVARLEREVGGDNEECFDVLMLGGSVLHRDYGDIEHVLRERLIRNAWQCVRIHNLAAAAHTSLDSYYKYRNLSGHHFDLVIVYHGINEVRANNCPSATFRRDYSHLSWYRLIDDFESGAESRWFVAPFTTKFVVSKVLDRLGWSGTLPTHRPEEASLEYGCDVKTAASFRANISGILDMAAGRAEPVLLMSFAFYIPRDYTEELFGSRSLDYTTHAYPVELWGRPDCVAAGITTHNEITADLAHGRPAGVFFVDQNALIPKEALYFNDVCHLTHEGCGRFADNALETVLELMP